MSEESWEDKTLAITGGTGSFGQKFLDFAVTTPLNRIVILSRDEFKHDNMRKRYSDSRIDFRICDVRDYGGVLQSLRGVNYVFHAAALKQVPSCESQPIEAVKTNILGSDNVLRAAVAEGVESVVVLSTDKAVQPVNAMGISKAMMEKLALTWANSQSNTRINITRYGNVLFSRGSVLPFFFDRVKTGKPILVTDERMTRFLLPLQDAIELVRHALFSKSTGSVFVRKSPAASVRTIVDTFIEYIDRKIRIETIGIRAGEKVHEILLSEEEVSRAVETELYFEVKGETRTGAREIYGSNTTKQLDPRQLWALLQAQAEFQQYACQ